MGWRGKRFYILGIIRGYSLLDSKMTSKMLKILISSKSFNKLNEYLVSKHYIFEFYGHFDWYLGDEVYDSLCKHEITIEDFVINSYEMSYNIPDFYDDILHDEEFIKIGKERL